MSERSLYRKYSIRFYFSSSEAELKALCLERTRLLLEQKSCRDLTRVDAMLQNEIEEVTLLVMVPVAVSMLHHAFDSKLNRPYDQDGCGAGLVSDDGKEYILDS